jgi:MFS transporter, DHA1 family, tetracycline resistance protein
VTRHADLVFVLVSVFLDALGCGLVLPVLPHLIEQLDTGREQQIYWYGGVSALYGFMQFLAAPGLGALSDRFGRRPVLLVSTFGLGLAFLLIGCASSLWLLVVAELICGTTSACLPVAGAYIADVTSDEERSRGFGVLGGAFGLGFIFGPMFGGCLGSLNVRFPFYAGLCICLVNGLYGWFVLPESLPLHRRSNIRADNVNPLLALVSLSRLDKKLLAFYASSSFAATAAQSSLVLYTESRLGWGMFENGIFFFSIGVAFIAVQVGLLGFMLKYLSERQIIIAGSLFSVAGYVCYGLAREGWMMYAILIGTLVSFATGPVLQGMASKTAKPEEQASVLGSLSAVSSLMTVAGPIIGNGLLARVAHFSKSDWRLGITFFLCAGIQGLGIFFFRRKLHPRSKEKTAYI